MKIKEAYQTLELQENASEDEIKKQFRKLAAKYHPDINKDPDAEAKSKKISEAYQILKDPAKAEPEHITQHPGSQGFWRNPFDIDLQEILSNIQPKINKVRKIEQHATTTVTISFVESILGCSKKIELERWMRCDPCKGRGNNIGGNCADCNGIGFKVQSQTHGKHQIRTQMVCSSCQGGGRALNECPACEGYGNFKSNSILEVKLTPGLENDQFVRLSGGGHYLKGHGYDAALLKITVIPDPNMKKQGMDVISDIKLSLLEALEGIEKNVVTVHGEKNINIPAKSKNLEEVKLFGSGVGGKGDHIFKLHVSYPENIDKLIEVLKE